MLALGRGQSLLHGIIVSLNHPLLKVKQEEFVYLTLCWCIYGHFLAYVSKDSILNSFRSLLVW